LQQQLASYIAAAGADAERYESGQRRIAALQELSSVSSSMRKATAKAMVRVLIRGTASLAGRSEPVQGPGW
jgi:hypothetical protein